MNEVIALLNQRLPLVSKNALVHLSLHDAPVVSECEVRASVHLSTEFHGVVVDHLLVPPLAELEAARACVYVAAWLDLCQELLDSREEELATGAPYAFEAETVPFYDLPEGTLHPLLSRGGDARSFRDALVAVRTLQLAEMDGAISQDDRVQSVLVPTLRVAVRMDHREARAALVGSRLGGVPYLPEGIDHPRAEQTGAPLIRAAQIDFSELSWVEGYPTRGIFQFFVANELGHGISDWAGARSARAIFYPDVHEAGARPRAWFSSLPRPFADDAPGAHEHGLTFDQEREMMSRSDHRFGDLVTGAGFEPRDFDQDDRVCCSGGNKLGGYPHCWTGDDARGAAAYRELGYELFLQLESNESIPVCWGRDQAVKIYVHPEALARGDFTNVLFDLS